MIIDLKSYTKGQEDLISKIKEDVSKILDKSSGTDMMLDIVDLLKKLKPIPLTYTSDQSSQK